jgi:hypothetical protein
MPLFDKADQVDQTCQQMRQSDFQRATNRAFINKLFNGDPPFSPAEAKENEVVVNFNDLTAVRLSHDARAQFYNGFLKPGSFFTAKTDRGPVHRRSGAGVTVTRNMNRIMKNSIRYFECMRSTFAQNVLHGIGPSVNPTNGYWCPKPIGIEDVFMPSDTLLTLENVPFFAIRRSFTAPEFIKMTRTWWIPSCVGWTGRPPP